MGVAGDDLYEVCARGYIRDLTIGVAAPCDDGTVRREGNEKRYPGITCVSMARLKLAFFPDSEHTDPN